MLARALLFCTLLTTSGCYYTQAVRGQMDLLSRREPIAELIADPALPDDLRARLETAVMIRDYASEALHLPDNGSYRSYADLERPYAVWNVFATPEFSVEAKQWCFPVVGCVVYRGYFEQAAAQRFAATLAEQSYDIYVGPVPAYSTLGRFDDPVLNTMLTWSDVQFASVMFHELAHQVVYFKGDAAASESFAAFVEAQGVRSWLSDRGDQHRLREFELDRSRSAQFTELVASSRERLRTIYASDLDPVQMRLAKTREFERLRREYRVLRHAWDGYDRYDPWFARDLNNAHLVTVATYHSLLPGWQGVFETLGGDLDALYAYARSLAELDTETRHARLDSFAPERSMQQPAEMLRSSVSGDE